MEEELTVYVTVYCDRHDCAYLSENSFCTKEAIAIDNQGRCTDEE